MLLDPNIYSASWLSDVCCRVDTCVQHGLDVGGSWRPEMEPKTAPYGLQDGLKTDQATILRGFGVRTSKRTIGTLCPHGAATLGTGKLGPWEEGREEGKPSTHIVQVYSL